jgi:hypothetical protein
MTRDADDSPASAERLASIEDRLARLEGHRLPERVTTLEAGFLRVERQLDLVFSQGQANARALGEQRAILDRVASLLEQLVRQQMPSVEVSRG